MKRKKTRPPHAESGDIQEAWQELRQLAPGANRYQAAEAARAVYSKARALHWRFRLDSEASSLYAEAQKCYWRLIGEAYPPTFDQDLVRLGEGDPSGLESIVTFLEADPIFDGTGYLKERLIRAWPVARFLTDDLPALMLAAQEDRTVRRRARWVLEALGEKVSQG